MDKITYQITNTIQESPTNILIFVSYSNGSDETERFPLNAKVMDILLRLQARAAWFDEQSKIVTEQVEQLKEDISNIE